MKRTNFAPFVNSIMKSERSTLYFHVCIGSIKNVLKNGSKDRILVPSARGMYVSIMMKNNPTTVMMKIAFQPP